MFWSQVRVDPEPWLAESAEPSPDGRVWTVKLREGVRWHDGVPFTADDVKFSFEYYRDQAGASGRYAHHVFDVPDFDRAEVVDPLTVSLFFNVATPQFKIMPGGDLPMMAKHIWEGVAEPATATDKLPVPTVEGPVNRRKLIFFSAADPRENPRPAWSAYHFAEVAARAGLEAEVRLAGDTVRVALADQIASTPMGDQLREKVHAATPAPYMVSL